ncbi:hypothetical protein [Hyalangium versicolor]|uniref:hypothetical protein n=1 Tax=Hyalangium versicolor TaxID=2861190 RepID=UPI001CCFA67F|nr:hypothetical protein [Hyalangium versicolor]
MASMRHDGLVSLFRNHPALAPELLQEQLGVALPDWSEARVESSEFTQVVPTEYRADLVVLLLNGKPVFAIVVEVQLSRDEDKRKSWPLYLTSLRSQVDCPTALLVVAPDPSIARWCARPIDMGHPGFVLRPLVAGPDAIPRILGPQEAGKDPELAVLSAMAHGHEEELTTALMEAVISSARGLDDERFSFYVDLTLSMMSGSARRALEAMMQSGSYQYQSELVRKLLAQGREQGREQGQQEGRLEGERRALLKVLDARGLVVNDAARRKLLACTDLEQMEHWLHDAVVVNSVQELFKRKPGSKPTTRAADKQNRSAKPSRSRSKQ